MLCITCRFYLHGESVKVLDEDDSLIPSPILDFTLGLIHANLVDLQITNHYSIWDFKLGLILHVLHIYQPKNNLAPETVFISSHLTKNLNSDFPFTPHKLITCL